MVQISNPESGNATRCAPGGAQTEPPWVTEPVETSPLNYRRPGPKEQPKQVIEHSEILDEMANMTAAIQQTINLLTQQLESMKKSSKDRDEEFPVMNG